MQTTLDGIEPSALTSATTLRESQLTSDLAESPNHVLWILDLAPIRRLTYVSPSFERIWGRSAAELYATPSIWSDAIHPDDRPAADTAFDAWLADPRSHRYDAEYRVLRQADGAIRWMRDTAHLVVSDIGRPMRATGIAEDITPRRLADQALRDSEERFRQIADTIDHVFWVLDLLPELHVSYVSPAFETIWGQPVDALYADPRLWLACIHDDDRTRVGASFDQWLDDPTTQRYAAEYRVVQPGGQPRWISDRGQAVLDEQGRVRRVTGVAKDITERKTAEQALSESQARLQSSFNHMHDGLVISNLDGLVSTWNPAAMKMFGFTDPEECRVAFASFQANFAMATLSGEPIAVQHWPLARVLRGDVLKNLEVRVRDRRNGWERVFEYDGALVRDADGQPRSALLHIADITDRRRHDDEILRLNAELEQRVHERTASLEVAVKELEAFSYSVSHDLRAPLRALDGFTQVVLKDYGALLPDTGRNYLDVIRKSARDMGRLIDDLLAFSRLSHQPLAKMSVNTAMLVRNALRTLAPMQTGREIELVVGDLPPSQCDPAMLQQVWVNLLSNALKYSRERKPALIEVGCQTTERGDEYFVRDNGAGFDMRHENKLFGVFERLHRADEFEGTGVGLAIVQRIVQRHGGEVRAEAWMGRGATFFFTLGPAVADA